MTRRIHVEFRDIAGFLDEEGIRGQLAGLG